MQGMGRNIVQGFYAAIVLALLCGGTLVGAIVYFLIKKASC